MTEELWTEVYDIVQEAGIKTLYCCLQEDFWPGALAPQPHPATPQIGPHTTNLCKQAGGAGGGAEGKPWRGVAGCGLSGALLAWVSPLSGVVSLCWSRQQPRPRQEEQAGSWRRAQGHLSREFWGSQVAVAKTPPVNAGDTGDTDLIPGSGRSPTVGNGDQLQYSCLELSMDRRSLVSYSPWGRKESDTTE